MTERVVLKPDERKTFMCVDKFSTLDDLRAKDRTNDEAVLAALRTAGRFSVFEATEHETLARTLTRLTANGRLKTDNSCGYPWVKVVAIDGMPLPEPPK